MDIRVGGITRKEFDENAKWVVKFTNRPRIVDTYPNIVKRLGEDFFDKYDVRDLDLLCDEGQPDIIKEFIKVMHEIDRKYGWMTIPEIFDRFGVRC